MAQAWNVAAIVTGGLAAGLALAEPALAQKSGGILRSYNSSNPPSASIIEEATIATAMSFSGVFNNLLIFDQSKPRNGFDTISPELAESWAWDASRTRLTLKLRQGVKWHDGKPFTAKDVQCTWNKIQGKDPDEFRKNPRQVWWSNLKEVTIDGDFEATFVLARPQASFPALLASNLSPVYPCHVPTKDMRTKPIGTGPFKFVVVRCQHVGQARQEHRLLEAGASLPRRRRVQHHRQPLDPHPGFRRQRVRPHLRCRCHGAADGRRDGALAQGHLPAGAHRRQHQSARQPQQAALRQRAAAPGHDAGPRPAGHDRHRQRRQVQHRRRHDAAARGRMGHAQGHADGAAGLRRRHRHAAGRGAQDHGGPRLRPQQAPEGQGVDARLPGVQGPCRAARRSAQPDLLRGRARDHRVLRFGTAA